MGTVLDREVPCMSGSSNRTHSIPSFCHASRVSFAPATGQQDIVPPRPRHSRAPGSWRHRPGGNLRAMVDSSETRVLPLELDRRYPVLVRGRGVWVEDAGGRRYLDTMSGGSMAATLGHGRTDIIEAGRAQPKRLAYVHNERLTNPEEEKLARELVEVAPEGFTRARFVASGSDANEMAVQLARSYHVERGEPDRWQVISPAQAYHGPTMETLALTGRPGLQGPFGPYLPRHLHIPPSTWRFDPGG